MAQDVACSNWVILCTSGVHIHCIWCKLEARLLVDIMGKGIQLERKSREDDEREGESEHSWSFWVSNTVLYDGWSRTYNSLFWIGNVCVTLGSRAPLSSVL